MASQRLYRVLKKLLMLVSKAITFFLTACIIFIRPMLGPANICPFTIGCTQYALEQLAEQPLLIAIKNIVQRLMQCHPFGSRS